MEYVISKIKIKERVLLANIIDGGVRIRRTVPMHLDIFRTAGRDSTDSTFFSNGPFLSGVTLTFPDLFLNCNPVPECLITVDSNTIFAPSGQYFHIGPPTSYKITTYSREPNLVIWEDLAQDPRYEEIFIDRDVPIFQAVYKNPFSRKDSIYSASDLTVELLFPDVVTAEPSLGYTPGILLQMMSDRNIPSNFMSYAEVVAGLNVRQPLNAFVLNAAGGDGYTFIQPKLMFEKGSNVIKLNTTLYLSAEFSEEENNTVTVF